MLVSSILLSTAAHSSTALLGAEDRKLLGRLTDPDDPTCENRYHYLVTDSIDPHPALQRMLRSFDAAAVDFSLLPPHLWDPVAAGTVEVSKPQPGEWA